MFYQREFDLEATRAWRKNVQPHFEVRPDVEFA